jgi:hypothetical protein
MTVKQAVRDSGYNYGSREFKQYVFEHNIELLAKKGALKTAARKKRKTARFISNNE